MSMLAFHPIGIFYESKYLTIYTGYGVGPQSPHIESL